MSSQSRKEHEWLQSLVGDWTYECEASMGPDQPPAKMKGKESVSSLGGLWVVCRGEGETPTGTAAQTIMTLGYDPAKRKFVGTFIASMMCSLWIYEGRLDESANRLVLDADGPSSAGDGTMAKYQDIIATRNPDERTLTSQMLGPDGKWIQFMHAVYRRVK